MAWEKALSSETISGMPCPPFPWRFFQEASSHAFLRMMMPCPMFMLGPNRFMNLSPASSAALTAGPAQRVR